MAANPHPARFGRVSKGRDPDPRDRTGADLLVNRTHGTRGSPPSEIATDRAAGMNFSDYGYLAISILMPGESAGRRNLTTFSFERSFD